ncbi:hypothetical protein LCM20_08165 [Halobacillus litoralis]|uniref:hypothetical protein n=1 Tax=Halobacillus litoralis TaxID=45668 RepID=UPI001CD39525|nr:hypothetical protein [Halobacillus litoralis]MCA0970557.1 hypothetical protein [Halobacillus litoralis]
MKKCFLLFFLFLLIGCQAEETESFVESNGSYQAELTIRGVTYMSLGQWNEGQYTIEEEIGEVKTKVDLDYRGDAPEGISSNYLNEGTPIYSVQQYSDVFLAEREDGTYEIFD